MHIDLVLVLEKEGHPLYPLWFVMSGLSSDTRLFKRLERQMHNDSVAMRQFTYLAITALILA